MFFKPLPILTLAAVPALALLVALGVWQLDRMAWKKTRIEAWRAAQNLPAAPLRELMCAEQTIPGRAAIAPEPADDAPAVRIYGRNERGAPGWRVFGFVPAPSCADAEIVLIETGFETLAGEFTPRPASRGLYYVRPAGPGPFTADPEPEAGRFYAFQPEAIAAYLGMQPSDLHVAGWLAASDGALPDRLARTPPARHFGYAITWFGLAGALIGVYAAVHASRGRLVFTGKKE